MPVADRRRQRDRSAVGFYVDAKRYLCFAEPGYHAALSPASQATLRLQGGPFDSAEASAFERRAHWRAAAALRRYDDTGKKEAASGRRFADFMPLMRGLLINR